MDFVRAGADPGCRGRPAHPRALIPCRIMLTLIRELLAHKAYADAQLLHAIRARAAAAADPELLDLLAHMLVANQFWVTACSGEAFVPAAGDGRGLSLDQLIDWFHHAHTKEHAWVAAATDDDLQRMLEHQLIPGGSCSVADAWMQVCLHSQGHRAQCATMLRRLGGTPPTTDFILWRITRPEPVWGRERE